MSLIVRMQSESSTRQIRLADSYTIELVEQLLNEGWEQDQDITLELQQGGTYVICPGDWQQLSVAHDWLKPDGTR